ncbi:hypothetical protein QCA50_013336 [Cerrena zonata]|uniref:Uncharacterized protein n=1 Tax=Cerrena zonata TaxID=2478898 RepID=A0AAW0G1S2_9APHY
MYTGTGKRGARWPPSLSPSFIALAAAYNEAIDSGSFIDVVLYAYSGKTPSGIYFEPLFSSSFEENRLADIDKGFPANKSSTTEDYDYECDSDLDSVAEEDAGDELHKNVIHHTSNASESISKSISAEIIPDTSNPARENPVAASDTLLDQGKGAERLGHVIFIPNIAYKTLRAVVSSMVCDEPQFLPLKSSERAHPGVGLRPHQAIPCSPKSAYRAADMLQLTRLKSSASQNIKSQLSSNNIVRELFSPFTSLYDEMIEMQIEYLFGHGQLTPITEALPLWTAQVAIGAMPYSGALLAKLIARGLPKIDKENPSDPTAETT